MTLYERFLEYESDPESLLRTGTYFYIIIGVLTALNVDAIILANLFDVSLLRILLDTNADFIKSILVLNLWNSFAPVLTVLLRGVGALSFLKIAFKEDQLVWLRMVSLIAIIVLLFGSFLF